MSRQGRPPGLRVHSRSNTDRENRTCRGTVSFDDGSMDHIPEEDWPTVGEASHTVSGRSSRRGLGSSAAGSCVSRGTSCRPTGRWALTAPVPENKADRRLLDHRSRLTRGGARLGGQDRRVLPMCSRGPRDRVRPGVLEAQTYGAPRHRPPALWGFSGCLSAALPCGSGRPVAAPERNAERRRGACSLERRRRPGGLLCRARVRAGVRAATGIGATAGPRRRVPLGTRTAAAGSADGASPARRPSAARAPERTRDS